MPRENRALNTPTQTLANLHTPPRRRRPRVLRPDKLASGMAAFVADSLGPAFVEPPPFDLEKCAPGEQVYGVQIGTGLFWAPLWGAAVSFDMMPYV